MNNLRLAVAIGIATIIILTLALLASLVARWVSVELARTETLRQSENRFRSLLQNTSDIIAIATPNGTVSYISASIQRILGYDSEDWIGKQTLEFLHPNDLARAENLLAQSLHSPAADVVTELRLKHVDGSWRDFEVIAKNLLSEPSVTGIVTTYHDITDRKHSDAEIRRTQAFLNSLIENIPAMIFVKDAKELRFVLWNKAGEELIGYSREELLGKNDYDFFPLEEANFFTAKDREVLASGKLLEILEESIQTRHRGSRTLRTKKIPIFDQTERSQYLLGISEDITERKQWEERLRLLESVVVNANDAVLITKAEPIDFPGPQILYVNAAFTHMTGYTPEEVLGKTPRILQGEKTDPATLDEIRRALKTWQPLLVELINYRKNGSEFWVELSIVPVADETGLYTHWVSVQRDITKRKQAEVETRKALEKEKELSELKSRFVSMASHEFRTPLAGILASSDLLKCFSHKFNEEQRQERLSKIQAEVKRMTRLLDDVLFINQAEVGRINFNPAPLDLAEFCQSILTEIEPAASKIHTFAFSCQGHCTTAEVDEKLLRQLLSNLLSNAVKYSPQGGTISFELVCEPKVTIFRIQDEGIGIPTADKQHLFEAFHRASNVGSIAGTGLGLTIIKNAVDAHQGRITIESEVGVGTTFTVYLPADQSRVKSDEKDSDH